MTTPTRLNRRDLEKFLPDQRSVRAFEQVFDVTAEGFGDLSAAILLAQDTADLAKSTADSATITANFAVSEIDRLNFANRGFNLIYILSDLPSPVLGVITLNDNELYYFSAQVDLLGARIECGQNTVIEGSSGDASAITSTGLDDSDALISSFKAITIRNIGLSSGKIIELDSSLTPSQSINIDGVNIDNCQEIGTIKGFDNVIISNSAITNSEGLVFDGDFDTIGISGSLLSSTAGTVIEIPSTATISRRFRINLSAIVVTGAAAALDVSLSALIPVEGYILETVNFSGDGTYTQGVDYDDNKSLWINSVGVTNSASITGYYMISNGTATPIASTGTPVKVSGITTQNTIHQRFTDTNNRATYTGAVSRSFKISVNAALTSNNNNILRVYVYKNGAVIPESKASSTANSGGRAEGISTQAMTSLNDTDYIEIWVENASASNDIVVEDLNVIIDSIS